MHDEQERDRAEARLGRTVADKYHLTRLLGMGSMGAVYAAQHTFTRKHVAIKLVKAEIAAMEGYTQRYLREARAATEIGHPGICDVVDAGQDEDGTLYIALELLEGRDMMDAIRADDLTLEEIVTIGAQVLDALAAAHDRGIVHRDIKPDNIFLTRDEQGDLRVKVLDFGVAKKTRGEDSLVSTRVGTIVGTPHYMSPEQITQAEVDGRADVWSVGATLYHALAKSPPFTADTMPLLMLRITEDTPARSLGDVRGDLPAWLVHLVDGALKKPREERWTARMMLVGLQRRTEPERTSASDHFEQAETLISASPFATETPDGGLVRAEYLSQTGSGVYTHQGSQSGPIDVTPRAPAPELELDESALRPQSRSDGAPVARTMAASPLARSPRDEGGQAPVSPLSPTPRVLERPPPSAGASSGPSPALLAALAAVLLVVLVGIGVLAAYLL